jgi:hypothetical protein
MYSDRKESLDVLGILLGSLHLAVAFSSREPSMPQGGTSKDEDGGWFEAVEGSEARSSRKIPNHPQGLWALHSLLAEEASLFPGKYQTELKTLMSASFREVMSNFAQ